VQLLTVESRVAHALPQPVLRRIARLGAPTR
jgi:hypothetical protein